MEKTMRNLELATAAFFPLLLLGGAVVGREAFDECLNFAYAMAMLKMALMISRWGTSAGTAGALAFLVIILGFAAMCVGIFTIQEERTQTALYHMTAGTSVALATAVTAAAAVLPGMSRPRQGGKGILETGGLETGGLETGGLETGGLETGGLETGGEKDFGRTKDSAKTLKSARVRTAGELKGFIQDLPQDTRILFFNIERGDNLTEGMDVQVKQVPAGTEGRLREGTGRIAPPTTPEEENSQRAPVLLFG